MKTHTLFILILSMLIIAPVNAGQDEMQNHQHDANAKIATGSEAISIQANEVIMQVHGIVCSFCTQGIKKKLAKFSFIDRTRLNKGILMDIENQRITIAIKLGETADIQGMFAAVLSGGYEPISALLADQQGKTQLIKAGF